MTMSSPGHTPTDIQSHLYLSFLHRSTADVALYAKGVSWEAVYHLHRVVLIQAGFFRSLFTAGFLETHRRSHSGSSYFSSLAEQVSVRFDDVNISRSAFEVCIARLYGGGPELYLSPSLVPTTIYPLTPSFYPAAPSPRCPPTHHPATPRFLLSLLATSIYLSIHSLTSQALSMVLSSIGPYTVGRYLHFANGKGIGPSDGDDPETAVGLEEVGQGVPGGEESQSILSDINKLDECDESGVTRKLSLLNFQHSLGREDISSVGDPNPEEPAFNYGGIGDKVGEACACWLTRWGADMLPYEEKLPLPAPITSEHSSFLRTNAVPLQTMPNVPSQSFPELTPPKIWARGGLTAPWVRAVISSNVFFIKDEWERYELSKRVVDLRRRGGIDDEEEKEWALLFEHGIHYSHMTFDELIRISQDRSPITGHPYVPIANIHSAHWMQSYLRHHILTRPSSTGSSPPPQFRGKELNITTTTSEILANLSSADTSDIDKAKAYYPIPVDASQRIGDTNNAFATASASADQLLGNTQASDSAQTHETPRQSNFFGIINPRYTAASCIQADATGKARWSSFQPFRFAVEFWGIGQLLEKSRLHSHTIWYAGSLFNVYVQVVRKKGVQLGVYLHRQSSVDPIPRASAPPIALTRILSSPPVPSYTPQLQSPSPLRGRGYTQTGSSVSSSSVAGIIPGSPRPAPPSSPSPSHFTPSTSSNLSNNPHNMASAPLQPYRDPRPTISAYFIISCASATGSSLTRFSSSPDQFSVSQSWGWKSSSLTEEHDEAEETRTRDADLIGSLRATVVMGLI